MTGDFMAKSICRAQPCTEGSTSFGAQTGTMTTVSSAGRHSSCQVRRGCRTTLVKAGQPMTNTTGSAIRASTISANDLGGSCVGQGRQIARIRRSRNRPYSA
jgi:hypothetical protein